MSLEVWISLLLAIPIGIGTALVTPVVQRKWDEKSLLRDVERSKRTLEEYRRIESFVNSPHRLTQYLIVAVIQTAIVSSFMVIFASIPNILGQAIQALPFRYAFGPGDAHDSFFLLGLLSQFVTLVGAVTIINVVRPALVTRRKVNDFDKYKQSLGELVAKRV